MVCWEAACPGRVAPACGLCGLTPLPIGTTIAERSTVHLFRFSTVLDRRCAAGGMTHRRARIGMTFVGSCRFTPAEINAFAEFRAVDRVSSTAVSNGIGMVGVEAARPAWIAPAGGFIDGFTPLAVGSTIAESLAVHRLWFATILNGGRCAG